MTVWQKSFSFLSFIDLNFSSDVLCGRTYFGICQVVESYLSNAWKKGVPSFIIRQEPVLILVILTIMQVTDDLAPTSIAQMGLVYSLYNSERRIIIAFYSRPM